MPARLAPLPALALLAALAAPVAAQDASLLASYTRATALIDSAVAAHGGVDALRAARHIRVTAAGHEFHRYQSRRAAPPYDSTAYHIDLAIDLARGVAMSQDTRGYPGGFYYTRRSTSTRERRHSIDLRNATYTTEPAQPVDPLIGPQFFIPHFQLLAAHEAAPPRRRRSLGAMRTPSGAIVDAVGFVLSNGAAVTLGFDRDTRRLRAQLGVGLDPLLGAEDVVNEYLDYRTFDGVLLPARVVSYRGGVRTGEYRYTSAARGFAVADSLLAPPAAFDDHVLLVDAPSRGAPDVIARLATLAPGKAIRYVVPTHHHDDHIGGVRDYAAAGATVVTTPGNAALATRLASRAPGAARVETITGGKRVFTDGARTVEIHDIGPNPHADEMLVAWLPAEGILYQADLIEAPRGVATRGSNADATMHLAGWIRRKGWTVRTFGGAHGFLDTPAEFVTLTAQRILPPN